MKYKEELVSDVMNWDTPSKSGGLHSRVAYGGQNKQNELRGV
jgi:hypothetical protein